MITIRVTALLQPPAAAEGVQLVSATDTMAILDNQLKQLSKLMPDPSGLSDGIGSGLFKTLGDRIDASDTALSRLALFRAFTDNVDLADAINTQTFRYALFSDAVSFLDRYVALHDRRLGEAQPTSDANTFGHVRSLTERQDLLDNIALQIARAAIQLLIQESVTVRDEVIKQLYATITDRQTATDEVLKNLRKIFAESEFPISDTIITSLIASGLFILTLTDSILANDTARKELFKLLVENETLNDLSANSLLRLLQADDSTVSIRDEIVKQFHTIIGDSQPTADDVRKNFTKIVSDAESITDTILLSLIASGLVTLTLLDSVVPRDEIRKDLLKTLSDGEQVIVQDVAIKVLAKVLTDQELASDVLVKELRMRFVDSETIVDLVDTQVLLALILLLISESVDVRDTTRKELFKILGDQVGVSDTMVLGDGLPPAVIDFIESMLTGTRSAFGLTTGSAREPRVVIKTGTRGTRK